jgi:perosamine synthetase
MTRIPVAGPWITQKEIAYVTDAVTNAWYSNANVYNERLERAFERFLGIRHAVALPSCTSGLHLSLLALGVGPGDEVIVPDITWIATSAPIAYVGATPVFADIDRNSWCLSAEGFEACITPRTKAVIPVDLYGNMPEMDRIAAIARRHGIAIIEDAAEAIGSRYKDRLAGTFGDVGVFSFHGSKTLVTGEGGMLVTDRDDLYERVQFLRDHGRKPGDRMFFNEEVGQKYKMGNLQAALGLAQLERLPELLERKRHIFGWYRDALGDVADLTLNHEAETTFNTYWMVTAVFAPRLGGKQRAMEFLDSRDIDTRPFFHPLSTLPAYAKAADRARAERQNVISRAISPHGLNLPSGLNMTEALVGRVADAVKQFVKT